MFNSKLKQQIALLEAANEQLQAQYNLVYDLLQQRQDEVVSLRKQLVQPDYTEVIRKAEICVKDQVEFRLSSFLKDGLCTSFVNHFMSSFKFNLDPKTYGTPISDCDEDDPWGVEDDDGNDTDEHYQDWE